MTIAVDFDGTLADTDATKIYSPNTKLIDYLIERRKQGDKIILWTCREGSRLEQAVEWCKYQGLEFDAVNDNLPGLKLFGINPRKVAADVYIDDAMYGKEEFGLPFRGWGDDMAALDGKITIGIDYRPCIVHIPAKKQSYRKKGDRINVYEKEIEPEHEIKALFHCWSHRSEVVGESPLRGGHPGGQVSGTFAIVEYEDGTIHEVEPTQIRFVDNAMSEYAFQEMEEK